MSSFIYSFIYVFINIYDICLTMMKLRNSRIKNKQFRSNQITPELFVFACKLIELVSQFELPDHFLENLGLSGQFFARGSTLFSSC